MDNVNPWSDMMLRLMKRRFFLEWAESQRPDLVPEHLREPFAGPARIISFVRPADRDLSDVARASITTRRFRAVPQAAPAEGEHGRGVDAVRVRATEQPANDAMAEPSTKPLANASAVCRRRPEDTDSPLTPGPLPRQRTEREGEFLMWAYSLMGMLLGCLILWGAWSAWDEGRLGAALGSAAIGAGLLLLGSALLAGNSDGAALYVAGAGGLFVLVGLVFLSGMFAGDPDSVRPIQLGRAPWAETTVGEIPVVAGDGILHARTFRAEEAL